MENQQITQVFPLLQKQEFYPTNMAKILSVFYKSNQKYFTFEELEEQTNIEAEDLQNTLDQLEERDEINDITSIADSNHKLYYLNVKGNIKNLQITIQTNKQLIALLEKIVDARDSSNQDLNQFIKQSISFNSEVLDFMEKASVEYFTKK
jgi:DNA-binding MarR family transcriptional regulator